MDNKLKIINYLGKHIKENFTMHELSKFLFVPYATFYRTLDGMIDLIAKEKKGNTILVRLKLDNPIISSYLAISSEEAKKEYLDKHPIINKILNELYIDDIVLLFGSYVKGKQTDKSDIDILIINKKGNKTISFSKHELLYKKKINPIFITINEFRDMLRDKEENVGKQVLKDHIILNNPKEFWECVLNAVR